MSRSKAQKFAQKRNTAGGTLKGIIVNLENNIIPYATEVEKGFLAGALSRLKNVHSNWNDNYQKAKEEKL